MGSVAPPPAFLEMADAYGIAFEGGDLERLDAYLRRLLATSEQFNLTAVRDPELAWTRHVFDSLTLLPWIMQSEAGRVIDVGSGGGLPGIPLAIVLPGVSFVLLEATGKKAGFLRSLTGIPGLRRLEVLDRQVQRATDLPAELVPVDVLATRAMGNWERVIPRLASVLTDKARVLLWAGSDAGRVLDRTEWQRKFELSGTRSLPGRDRAKLWILSPR